MAKPGEKPEYTKQKEEVGVHEKMVFEIQTQLW